MSELKNLIQNRGQIKGRLTRLERTFEQCKRDKNVAKLLIRRNLTESTWAEFDIIQTNIENLDETADHSAEREAFEDQYLELMAQINIFIDDHKVVNNSKSLSTSTSNDSSRTETTSINNSNQSSIMPKIKLPNLNLPNFNGQYEQWLHFHDTYVSLIHENECLNNIQKFHYLVSCLKGEASRLIDSLSISADNYNIAWELLVARYYNRKLIIKGQLSELFNLPAVSKDSPVSLRALLDKITLNLKVLKNLGLPTDSYDAIIIYFITTKLDFVSNREWESACTSEIPTMMQMTDFLTKRCQLLESLQFNKTSTSHNTALVHNKQVKVINHFQNHKRSNQKTESLSYHAMSKIYCFLCKQSHYIHDCPEFLKLSVDERINKLKSTKLCLNCLRGNHLLRDCKSSTCRHCQQRHNTLLHPLEKTSSQNISIDPLTSVSSNNHSSTVQTQVLLSTALVHVRDQNNKFQTVRALLDVGSQSNFITESTCKRLGLELKSANISIAGINHSTSVVNNVAHIQLKSTKNAFTANIICSVLPKITANLPLISINKVMSNIPQNIRLADPNFHISSPIDLLIGAELFWDLLCVGQIKSARHQPTLQKTHLGWIVGGSISSPPTLSHSSNLSINYNNIISDKIDKQLTQFWELENINNTEVVSTEQMQCELHFKENFSRNEHGKYIVRLPFKLTCKQLGESREIALKRFHSLERKLSKNADLKRSYSEFIDEYAQLGHMSLISKADSLNSKLLHLPHHCVLKPSSTTTKLRVVFDASAKTTSGVSLNDNLMTGPTIQPDLFSILLRFRTYKFILTGDLVKMYRQIWVHPDDRIYQNILWRHHPDQTIQTYQLNTVTYGTTSAPFLAIRVLQQLAVDEGKPYSLAYKSLKEDFYVDDLITGANNVSELESKFKQINKVLKMGGFQLSKVASNYASLGQSNLTNTCSQITRQINVDKSTDSKTLGLIWNPNQDILKYSLPEAYCSVQKRVTKRSVLAQASQLFDPLGLLGPITIRAKIILQKLWKLKLDWDETIPIELHTTWVHFISDLQLLPQLTILRNTCTQNTIYELIGFSDASEVAYGACIYIRSQINDGTQSTNLLCAKSRVAPVKTVSIPRLELCGAVLLAQLYKKVTESLSNITFYKRYFWTDSKVVLAWIQAEPYHWNAFVANRVSEIQSITKSNEWHYVNSKDNPADIISRGCTLRELTAHTLWWNGPKWLQNKYIVNPYTITSETIIQIPEKRKIISLLAVAHKLHPVFSKFSTFTKLQRVLAYCLRFINNSRANTKKCTGCLTFDEIENASTFVIRQLQAVTFSKELHDLTEHKEVNSSSPLRALNPFIDDKGIIRVGGRLRNSRLPYNGKFPIILPKHDITKLIIYREHVKHLHSGQQATLFAIRQTYWPISGRTIVRQVLHKCVTCFRANPKPIRHLMGDLPSVRLTPARPFLNCGVDFAGPIFIKEGRGRGKRTIKTYISLFICLVTKAVHLELVGDLSTEAFLGALKRFISRRGHVRNMYSDNGSNFIGAHNELNEVYRMVQSPKFQSEVIEQSITNNLSWHFMPPRAPHHGGIYEAGVKSVKGHLRRVVGNSKLTFEEMYTTLTTIEACLNSRPLTPLSNDPNDFLALTPGHFLIGDRLTAYVEGDVSDIPENRLSRWQRVEQLRQHFWKRWSSEYLNHLQQRVKWNKQFQNIDINTLVIIKEDNVPPLKWTLGRIISVHPGADKTVRVVTIKTATNTVKRSVTKVCPLPIDT